MPELTLVSCAIFLFMRKRSSGVSMASMDPLMVGPPPPGGPLGGSGSSPPSPPRPDIFVTVQALGRVWVGGAQCWLDALTGEAVAVFLYVISWCTFGGRPPRGRGPVRAGLAKRGTRAAASGTRARDASVRTVRRGASSLLPFSLSLFLSPALPPSFSLSFNLSSEAESVWQESSRASWETPLASPSRGSGNFRWVVCRVG